jgi:hypothetical protein
MWHGEAFPGLLVLGAKGLILFGALFPLDIGRSREGNTKEKRKEKNCYREEGFYRAGHALLAVQQVTAVRYN